MSKKERGNRGGARGKDDLDELKQMNKQKIKTKQNKYWYFKTYKHQFQIQNK